MKSIRRDPRTRPGNSILQYITSFHSSICRSIQTGQDDLSGGSIYSISDIQYHQCWTKTSRILSKRKKKNVNLIKEQKIESALLQASESSHGILFFYFSLYFLIFSIIYYLLYFASGWALRTDVLLRDFEDSKRFNDDSK